MVNKTKSAFTLAEVLITLVIIGVVAALTIPTAVTKYQKQETVSKLKKIYSSLGQTTARAIVDYGNVENWEMGAGQNPDAALTFFNTYMGPYLSLSEKAQKLSLTSWNKKYYYMNNSEHEYGNKWVRAYLADGSSLTMNVSTSSDSNKWFQIFVDINGDKKPNRMGKDIFSFFYFVRYDHSEYQGKILPAGIFLSRNELLSGAYSCNKNESGERCGALIIKDSWQIKNDYPW